MTNLEIQKHAARSAAEHATLGIHVEPEDAWHEWSTETGVADTGARLLFEFEYALCSRQSLWWQLLSVAGGAAGWRRRMDLSRAR